MSAECAYSRLREKFQTLNPGDQLRVAYGGNTSLIRKAAQKAGKHLSVFQTDETAFSERFGREVPVWLCTVL